MCAVPPLGHTFQEGVFEPPSAGPWLLTFLAPRMLQHHLCWGLPRTLPGLLLSSGGNETLQPELSQQAHRYLCYTFFSPVKWCCKSTRVKEKKAKGAAGKTRLWFRVRTSLQNLDEDRAVIKTVAGLTNSKSQVVAYWMPRLPHPPIFLSLHEGIEPWETDMWTSQN